MIKIIQFLMGIAIILALFQVLNPICATILSIPIGMLVGSLMFYSEEEDK